jgi:HK97 family phage prohead protease
MHLVKFDFQTKSTTKGLFIEGFGNANTIDRMNERIDPKGWKLDNYKKNPVLLFDHGKDMAFGSMPIGKAISAEPQDGGLYIKGKVTESKSDKLTAVRDLIEEGILKTFSVGFNPIGEPEKSDGVILIKSAELIECSVVPVPANQDSVFSVSNRSFKSAMASDWFNSYAKVHSLYKKGASFAAIVTDHIRRSGKDFPSVMELLKSAGIGEDKAIAILDGETVELSNDLAQMFAKALSIEINAFDSINLKGDDMAEETNQEEACDKPEVKEMTDEDMTAAMEQMKAEAAACAADGDGNPAAWVADEAAWQKAKEAADKTSSRDDAEKYYAIVTWLYLNRFGGTKKSMDETVVPKEENKPDEEGDKSTTAKASKQAAMPTGDNAVQPSENPHLELAKQTNVLLGVLVSEIQKLSTKLEKVVEVSPEPEDTNEEETPPAPVPNPEDEQKNLIANIQKSHEDLRKRIARISA